MPGETLFETPTLLEPTPSSRASYLDLHASAIMEAQALQDVASIENAISRTALGNRASRDGAEIEALLVRLLDIDPDRAVRLAAELPASPRLIVDLYAAWATDDWAAARSALSEIEDPGVRRTVGAELAALFPTRDQIAALAGAAAPTNADGFIVDALARLAGVDPLTAYRQARELADGSLRSETLERIARVWARVDPQSALRQTQELVDAPLRNRFHAAILLEWAAADPDAALDYLRNGEGRSLLAILPPDRRLALTSLLAFRRPAGAIAMADAMPGAAGQSLRASLSLQLVGRDLSAALSRFDSVPPGPERRELALQIAAAQARANPEEALRWALELDQASQRPAITMVVSELARVDLAEAMRIALAYNVDTLNPRPEMVLDLTTSQLAGLANEIASSGRSMPRAIAALLEGWSARDPAGVWNWMLEGNLENGIVESAARGFAAENYRIPPQSVYQLTDGVRERWVVRYASELAQRDSDAAVEWLQDLRNDPSYERWASDVASALLRPLARGGNPMAPLFPQPAAEILATMADPPRDLIVVAASRWATMEPATAVDWALALSDPEARSLAAAAAVGGWTVHDPDAARRQALALPAGDLRRRVLLALFVQEIASHGSVDQRVVDAIGSPSDFQMTLASNPAAVTDAFTWLASRDPARARQLLDRYVRDADLKASIRAGIDGGTGQPKPPDLLVAIGGNGGRARSPILDLLQR